MATATTMHASATVRDPVCGMTVDPATSKHRFDHHGETFHFCSAGCRTKFAADPASLSRRRASRRPKRRKARSTPARCIRRSARSAPAAARSAAWRWSPRSRAWIRAPNPELADMTRRFWIGLVLALPAVVLEMGGHLVGGHGWVEPDAVELDSAGLRHARGDLGGLAVLRARLAIAADAQSQHVHADRDGHRRRLCLQRRRHRRARHLPGRPSAAMAARSRFTSKPPRSSPCWCCWARCWSCAPARRRPARSRRCSNWRRRPRAASARRRRS